MKTIFTILIVGMFIFIPSLVFCQDYDWLNSKLSYNNTPITVGNLISADYNSTEKSELRRYFENAYSGLVFKADATAKYNCHYFAWFQSEQYPGTQYWLNYPENHWYDYSFVQVPSETHPGKVTYSYTDGALSHTANTTSTPNRFDSKWGQGCRFEHDYDECPYWNDGAQVLKYYQKLNISGLYSIECQTSVFRIPNTTGMNYSVSWSTGNNRLQILNQNNYSCQVSPVSTGASSIIANISRPGFNSTFAKNRDVSVRVDPPEDITYLNFEGNLCSNSINYFYTDNISDDLDYYWTINGNGSIVEGEGTSRIGVQSDVTGNLYVELRMENGCGMNNSFGSWFYIPDCYDNLVQLSPNPATDKINIKLSAEPEANSTIEISNFQSMGLISVPLLSKEQSVDISSLPQGLNILRIQSKSGSKTLKFIKK